MSEDEYKFDSDLDDDALLDLDMEAEEMQILPLGAFEGAEGRGGGFPIKARRKRRRLSSRETVAVEGKNHNIDQVNSREESEVNSREKSAKMTKTRDNAQEDNAQKEDDSLANEEQIHEETQKEKQEKEKQARKQSNRKQPRRDKKQLKKTSSLPDSLERVNKLFSAVTTVHSFLTVKGDLSSCTFDHIQKPVSDILGESVQIYDMLCLETIAPNMVSFSIVRKWELDLEDSISVGSVSVTDAADDDEEDEKVVLIEFLDGGEHRTRKNERRAQSVDATLTETQEEPLDNTKKKKSKKLNLPKLIERRNLAFQKCLREFNDTCVAKDMDPEVELRNRTNEHQVLLSLNNPKPDTKTQPPKIKVLPTPIQTVVQFLTSIQESPIYNDQIVSWQTVPNRPADFVEFHDMHHTVPNDVVIALENIGINRLYRHQSDAIDSVLEHADYDKGVVVSTSTSSGKSLIYQLPILTSLLRSPETKALMIYPTKALAQDQLRAIRHLLSRIPSLSWVNVEIYDGDTPVDERRGIRDRANVVITNPDMLHSAICPHHKYWDGWWKHLKYIIVDEMHVYNAQFGSHFAYLFRRLRRIHHHYKSRSSPPLAIIASSATIASPTHVMSELTGLPIDSITLVNRDGSPCGQRHHICWNPPLVNPFEPQLGRLAAIGEVTLLAASMVRKGIRCVVFCKTRKLVEIVLKKVREELVGDGLEECVMAYRGGYTPQDRRDIERRMFAGELLAIIATTALELGVDIGSLDAVIHVGFPFTLSSYAQQCGRSGRRNQDSLSILVADGDNLLDQYYMSEPDGLLKGNQEIVLCTTEALVAGHLQCAASEIPIDVETDTKWFGETLQQMCKQVLPRGPNGLYYSDQRYQGRPSTAFPLRGPQEDTYRVIDLSTMKDLEDLETSRAIFTIYIGAVFLHQGLSYLVVDVDTWRRVARVRPTKVDYITAPRDFTNVDPIQSLDSYPLTDTREVFVTYGQVRSIVTVFGYYKINPHNKKIMESIEDNQNLPYELTSLGIWIDLPSVVVEMLEEKGINVEASVHAASHALISVWTTDKTHFGQSGIRTECKHPNATRPRPPRLIVYDAPGSGDSCRGGFHFIRDMLTLARNRVNGCACEEGCLECGICWSCCHEANQVLSKEGAKLILNGVFGLNQLSPTQCNDCTQNFAIEGT